MKHFVGTEITEQQAISLWNDKAIFAYDVEEDIDWQINTEDLCSQQSVLEILNELKGNEDIVLYVEN